MLKLKLRYFGHLMFRADSLGKTLMLGKNEGRRRRRQRRMRWLDGITDWMDIVWANSGSWWWTGKPGMLQSMGFQRVRHYWATEQQQYSIITLFTRPSMPIKCSTSRQEYQISYLFHSLCVFQCNWTEVLSKWAFYSDPFSHFPNGTRSLNKDYLKLRLNFCLKL